MTNRTVRQGLMYLIVGLALVVCLASTAFSQTDPTDEQGLKPFGSYHGGDIDVVNLMNGKLDLHAQVVSYPQRGGKLNMGFTLRYGNPLLYVDQICDPQCHNNYLFYTQGVQVLPDFQMSLAGYVANNKNVTQLKMVDGSIHELGTVSGTVSETLDGTGWRYDSGADVATDRQGVRYTGPGTGPISQEDPNGNWITGSSSGWTDSLGRVIPNPPSAGTSNTSDYSNCTGSQPTSGAYNWVVPGFNGGSSTYKFCWASFSFSFPIPEQQNQNYSGGETLLQSLVLPNNQAWTFEYDTSGNLSTITLPTGGTISYTWGTARMCAPPGGAHTYSYYRGVGTRSVNANDGSGAHTWTYALDGVSIWPNNPSSLTSTVTDPAGNQTVYAFGAQAACAFYEGGKTEYQGPSSGGNVLRMTTTSYSSSTDENAGAGPGTGINNVLASEIDTYSYSGSSYRMKGVKKTYDQGSITYTGVWGQGTASYGNLISESEYDYGTGTGLGPLIRTTNTAYVTSSAYTNNNIVSLPASVQVLDANSNQIAYAFYGYDATSLSGGPYGQYRGNQTSVNRWLNTINAYLTSSKIYNGTGTVQSSTDPGNHSTSYAYDSTGTYVIQTNFPDTNSPSLAHHITHALYDTNTGLLTSHTDENGNSTTYGYDSMLRIQTVTYPAGGGAETFTYDDTPPSLSVELQHTIDGSRSTNEYVIFDQLGREISRSKANDESVPWDKNDTCYDVRGLKTFVSYPYQSSAYNSAQVCSGTGDSYAYDALKRTTSVTHADGTSIVTAYSGAATSVTDEGNGTAATQKVSQVDGLGRLISVCEVTSTTLQVGITPAPGSCGQTIAATGFLTSYQYDVLGNLQTVTQGGLTARNFTYNSLSQLLTANNPESGTTSYGYDSEGNLTSRTRPAPNQTNAGTTVTTTYTPDALHRTTAITYSDGTTPSSTFQYDQSSVSNQNPQNPSGRLTYESSANGNAGAVFSYDKMGRVLNEWQCTPQNCSTGGSFPVAFGYDFAGGLTSLNNGVGTTFTYAVNREQRPTTVTSNYIQNGNPATMFSAVHYDGFGSVLSASLGNGVNETYSYVPRGWLQSVAAGGSGMVNHPATPGAGSVTVGGTEQSDTDSTPGTGTVVISGTEQSNTTDPCQKDNKGSCPITTYDAGYVQITVNGFNAKYTFGQNDTSATIASALNTTLNGSSSPVTSTLSNGKLTLTSKAAGSNTTYSLSATSTYETDIYSHPSFVGTPSGGTLTGGTGPTTTYDSGTVKITISGSLTASVSYGSSSTPTNIASSLAAELNGTLVTAHSSGGVITITSVATGSDTDYSVALSVVSNAPSDFNPPSFSLSSSTGSHLAGGGDQNITGAAYTLDMGYSGNDNVLSAEDSVNGNWSYTYDPMNRLATGTCAGNATAHCPDGTATQGYKYLYDRFGNRWQQDLTAGTGPAPQYNFDANNHMIGASYDAAGNMLNDGFHSYIYDAENRIIQVDGGPTATYAYDAEGRRVRKVAGTTVDYLYDHAGRQIAELNTSGGWTREEVYVGGRHLATYSGTTTYFHNADWLGTERARTDVNGVVYETCQSLPYGDGQACAGGEPSPMHFTGKQRDGETNLDDFPARYYSSTQGRWLSPDWDTKPVSVPYAILGNPQTLNLYSYVGGDPTNHADADGHEQFCSSSTCPTSADSSSEAKNKGSGQAEDKPQNNGQQNLSKEDQQKLDYIKSTLKQNKEIVAPLVELLSTVVAFISGGEGEKSGSPEASIESPEETAVSGGKRTFSAADRTDALEGTKDAAGVPRCQYCGKELTTEPGKPNSYEADHTLPYSRGGKSTRDNLTPACRNCNRSKGARTPDEWLNQ